MEHLTYCLMRIPGSATNVEELVERQRSTLSKQLRLDVAQLTDVGRKRPHNEDNMAYVIPKDPQVMIKKGALFIVADGMGGHAAGEVASEIAVDTVSYAYYQEDSDDIAVSLVHAIKRANTLIHQRAAENMLRSGMGTTCVAGVLRGGTAYIANVGDSRTYLVRNGQVRQVSQDHSWVAEQVRAGLLTEEQARSHAQRNVITRCLGTQAEVEVDIFSEQLQEGDSFILCSDGLSGFISDEDLRVIINKYVPQESVYHLIECANTNGGPDNITAIVVRVQEVGWDPAVSRLNGHANGRDITTQTTLTDAQMMMDAPSQGGNGQAPLRLATGPLHPADTVTAPQPVLPPTRRKRGRLLYPTLVLFVLLVVVLVGSGIAYLLHINSPQDFDASYTNARVLIQRGQDDVTKNNPAKALEQLKEAQAILLSLQNKPLTDAQKNMVKQQLDGSLTTTVKTAITSYNVQSSITALSCTSKTTSPIKNGNTSGFVSNIATIENDTATKSFSYAWGENDPNLYQLNRQQDGGRSLQSTYTPEVNTKVLSITSAGSRLLSLTGPITPDAQVAKYSIAILVPDDNGGLKTANQQMPIDPEITKNGNTPRLMTVSGTDVYVLLASNTSPTSATILHYTLDSKNNKLSQPDKNSQTISTSNSIVSIAAFPHQQLFLLAKAGDVQSLTFTGGTQAPTPVAIQPVIATPLAFDVNTFSSAVPIAPPTPTLGQSKQQSNILQVPNAKFLVAGTTGADTHLYIVDDGTSHRVLDLETMKGGTTAATPTSASVMKMQLVQQYTSISLFTNVKGIVADPDVKVARLYLIMQGEQNVTTRNFATVTTGPNAGCAS